MRRWSGKSTLILKSIKNKNLKNMKNKNLVGKFFADHPKGYDI